MPDPRDFVAPVDEGAEVAPDARLTDQAADDIGPEEDEGRVPGRHEEPKRLDEESRVGERPHSTEPDEPPAV